MVSRKLVMLVTLALSSADVGASPQAPQPAVVQTQAAPQTPQPLITNFKKTVGLLHVGYHESGIQQKEASGTVFLVNYPDSRLGEKGSFGYLVTNRHVVEPGIEDQNPHHAEWMTFRLNRTDATQNSTDELLPLSPALHWYFPANDSVDLAVLPLAPDQKKYDFQTIPVSMFATRDVVKAQMISEGDSILFAGFFYQFPGRKKFEPIIREGIIAMIPDEEMDTTLKKPGHIYLADVHVYGGNSGSPLLVNVGGMRQGRLMPGQDYRLIGVISGYYLEDANFNLTVATTLTGTLQENSGIAVVTPADELKALLDSPTLQALRDAGIPKRGPKN